MPYSSIIYLHNTSSDLGIEPSKSLHDTGWAFQSSFWLSTLNPPFLTMCYSDDICNVVLPFEKEKHNMPSTRNCSNPPPQKESTNVRWQPCFVAPSFRHSLLHETI